MTGDVSDPAVAESAVATAVERFGALHVLANVAGILRTARTHEHDFDDLGPGAGREPHRHVRLLPAPPSPRCSTPAAAPSSTRRRPRRCRATRGRRPTRRRKGGVLALTKVIAVEYAREGIRANCVCPGSIDTPITGDFVFPEGVDTRLVKRLMAIDQPRGPETVAAAIAFLASDDAAHVNGESLRVDGGTLA